MTLPSVLQELVAVGSAVAAVTALPAQAADQLKAAAEQVTEATQLLKHQVGLLKMIRNKSLHCPGVLSTAAWSPILTTWQSCSTAASQVCRVLLE